MRPVISMSPHPPSIVDLFSGAGGLSHGMELAGFQTILAIDNNLRALETFKRNHHRNAQVEIMDLHAVNPLDVIRNLDLPEPDGIVGGPPCQGFSDARGSRRVSYANNQLIRRFMDWVEQLEPAFFVMENVVGITTINNGKFFNHVLRDFQDMGYRVQHKILHAGEYGVPQKRERMFLIGLLNYKGSEPFHPCATHFIPQAMKGLTGSHFEKATPARTPDEFTGESRPKSEKQRFTTVGEAFSGLPNQTPENGLVVFKDVPRNQFQRFIRRNGAVSETTAHISQAIKKAEDKHIAARIPEGCVYRSNRFGDRYVPVWVVFEDRFDVEELELLELIGRNQVVRSKILERDKEEGHVDKGFLLSRVSVTEAQISRLTDEKWVSRKTIDGRTGLKLITRAGLRPRFMRLNRESISNTILTMDFDAREKLHPTIDRGLSLREGARLQSFPDDFEFEGSFREIAIQIGNAVPPLLANMIGRHLMQLIYPKSMVKKAEDDLRPIPG